MGRAMAMDRQTVERWRKGKRTLGTLRIGNHRPLPLPGSEFVALCFLLLLWRAQLQSIQEEPTLHFTRMLAANDTVECLHFGKHRMRDHGCLTMVS